jgi:hypothetical protein
LIRVKPAFWEAIDCAALDSIVRRVAYKFLSSVHGKTERWGDFHGVQGRFVSFQLFYAGLTHGESGLLVLFRSDREFFGKSASCAAYAHLVDSHH